MRKRRSQYALDAQLPVSDEQIERALALAVKHVPSAFNSQTARVVLLLGEHHRKLWGDIVMETLRAIVPPHAFAATQRKIEAFAAAYGTVLYFEDTDIVKGLQHDYAIYADKFPVWSQHTSAMHQYAVWCLLAEMGVGASLQHYNPIIDERVRAEWGIPESWQLVAQMPFGRVAEQPEEKEFAPLEARLIVHK